MNNFHFSCPKCGKLLDATSDLRGQVLECPSCDSSIEVPKAKLKLVEIVNIEPAARSADERNLLSADPLRPCPKCGVEISILADLCPICWSKIKPPEKNSVAEIAGAGIGVAALTALAPVYAAIGGLGAAIDAGGDFVTRKAVMAKNRSLGAVDIIIYDDRDDVPGYVIVTRDSLVQVISAFCVPVKNLTVERSQIKGAQITAKKKIWGGVKVEITINTTNQSSKPFIIKYSMNAAEKKAEMALIKLNHYARAK